jgi:hypothetical protein
MPGCLTLPDECAPPDDDPQSPDDPQSSEGSKAQMVRSFIDALWNYRWTDAERATSRDSKAGGGEPVMPATTDTALTNYLHGGYTRHRRDGSGTRKSDAGQDAIDGLIRCIDLVHEAVTDLQITILDVVVCGDCVTVLLLITGTDVRPDGRTDVPGLFGAASPTGRRFRVHTAVLYCFEGDRIRHDYLLYGADLLMLGQSYVGPQPKPAV